MQSDGTSDDFYAQKHHISELIAIPSDFVDLADFERVREFFFEKSDVMQNDGMTVNKTL